MFDDILGIPLTFEDEKLVDEKLVDKRTEKSDEWDTGKYWSLDLSEVWKTKEPEKRDPNDVWKIKNGPFPEDEDVLEDFCSAVPRL